MFITHLWAGYCVLSKSCPGQGGIWPGQHAQDGCPSSVLPGVSVHHPLGESGSSREDLGLQVVGRHCAPLWVFGRMWIGLCLEGQEAFVGQVSGDKDCRACCDIFLPPVPRKCTPGLCLHSKLKTCSATVTSWCEIDWFSHPSGQGCQTSRLLSGKGPSLYPELCVGILLVSWSIPKLSKGCLKHQH